MSRGESAFVDELLQRVPELTLVLDEHLSSYDKLLPHVFLGDVTRYVVEQVRTNQQVIPDSVRRAIEFLEEAMASEDESVLNLISVSFLENLIGEEAATAQLRSVFGPRLGSEFARYETM